MKIYVGRILYFFLEIKGFSLVYRQVVFRGVSVEIGIVEEITDENQGLKT